MIKHLDKLESYYKNFKAIFSDDSEEELDLNATLAKFIDNNPAPFSDKKCIELIAKASHLSFAEAIVSGFLAREVDKIYCVWLHGERNSGKSKFIELIE